MNNHEGAGIVGGRDDMGLAGGEDGVGPFK
jgi:hypothetical protein